MYEKNKIGNIVVLSLLSYHIPWPISHDAKIVFSILILSALLWITESIPLFLTSLIATLLLVFAKIFTFKEAMVEFADPVVVLLFGGFLIAHAMQDVQLDRYLAKQILAKVQDNRYALLVLMFVTAFLSMWISNTATTVVMIPIALGIVAKYSKKINNFSKAVVLGIAFSANIGGSGTIIGSTPNALAVSKLAEISLISVSFLDWIKAALPIVIILIPIAWFILQWIFPFEKRKIKIKVPKVRITKDQSYFLIIFVITILLWLTTHITGLSSSMVALLGATTLFLFQILKIEDLNKINYQVLILFGGGLVLGSALFKSGLSDFFAQGIAYVVVGQPSIIILIILVLFSIILSAFASNTATAAIIIPIMISLAKILPFSPKMLAMISGIAVSFTFLLPVGTPPNAIAYSSGKVSTWEMVKGGSLLTLISILVLSTWAFFMW